MAGCRWNNNHCNRRERQQCGSHKWWKQLDNQCEIPYIQTASEYYIQLYCNKSSKRCGKPERCICNSRQFLKSWWKSGTADRTGWCRSLCKHRLLWHRENIRCIRMAGRWSCTVQYHSQDREWRGYTGSCRWRKICRRWWRWKREDRCRRQNSGT